VAAEVWYRKWRPQTFADVAGQRHVTVTLARAVAQGRVAHAYLFCGPRGTGKTSTARILAKAVNCEANEGGQPCGRCASCIAVTEGRALDLIEMDAASNRGIDEIRNLRDKVGFSPNAARYKVYLIDEVHELTQFAFDALLKTLEEPPPHVIFILATTEAHKVPETILSRCQRFDFVRIKLADVVARLRQICDGEGVTAEDAALEVIARRATGSLRDAVNLLEQAVNAHGAVLTETMARVAAGASQDARAAMLARLTLERRLAEALSLVAEVRDDGVDLRQFTRDVTQHLRSLLLVRAGAAASLDLDADTLRELSNVAEAFPVARILQIARTLTKVDFRADPLSPLPLELAVVECIEAQAESPVSAGLALEQRAAGSRSISAAEPASEPNAPSAAARVRERLAPRTAPPPPLRIAAQRPAPAEGEPTASEAANGAAVTAASRDGADAASALAAAGVPALTLDAVRRKYREFCDRCREIDRRAGPYVVGRCDIVEVGPGEIVLGLAYANQAKSLESLYLKAVQRAAADVFGAGHTVRIVHDETAISRHEALAAERPSHLLDEALKLGAKPVEPA